MNDKIFIILCIPVIGILLLTDNTQFELVGYFCWIVLFGTMSILQIYRYNEKKHQFSNISFKFKRDNFIWSLINCYMLGSTAYENNFDNFIAKGYTTSRAAMDIVIFIFVVIQAYICIAHKPILSTEGFLCSDGKFIKFSDVTSIISDDNPMLKHKRLTVGYKSDDSLAFKVKDSDYENIKRHIMFYCKTKIIEK